MSDRSPTAGELALYERACAVRERAYAPYSRFPVGAVLLAEDGRAFEGVNVENGSIGLTICAERSACVRAVSEGVRRFTAIAVSTHDSAHTGSPCGACRQFLSEFGLDLRVVYRREGEVVAEPLSALLPAAFELRS
jgi:cytidine deaminase